MKQHLYKLCALCMAAALAGCGGGGGGSSVAPPVSGASGRLGVLVTDSFREDFSHVWVTLYKVVLNRSTGMPVTVFDDSAGRVIDLKTLRDATGARFSFLTENSVPSANYSGAQVTIGNTLSLIPAGAATGSVTPLEDSLPRDGQGHPQIAFPLSAPRDLGRGADDLVIDFDLANFLLSNGKVRPALKEGAKSGIDDPARHENEEYHGTVSNLSGIAPNFTFTLTRPGGMTVAVVTSASTTLFNSNAAPDPTLANGKTVEVRGRFNTASHQLTATSIKIEDSAEAEDRPEVRGVPSAIHADAGTFQVSPLKAKGFVPTTTTVNVVTDASTVFRAHNGLSLSAGDFFTRLATATFVEVEGSFDAGTNTLTARHAKLEDESEHDGSHGGGGQGNDDQGGRG
jgi:hypothetical protein